MSSTTTDRRWEKWTADEDARLKEAYEAGASHQEIADDLGRTRATVSARISKFYVHQPTTCEFCRQPLTQPPRGRRKIYCNERCREQHDAALYFEAAAEKRPDACEQCNGPLPHSRTSGRYCSRACSQRAWHERTKNDPERRAQIRRAVHAWQKRRYWADGHEPKYRTAEVVRAEAKKVIALRRKGKTYKQIAEKLGISERKVNNAIQRAKRLGL